jgi:hypothetical protein
LAGDIAGLNEELDHLAEELGAKRVIRTAMPRPPERIWRGEKEWSMLHEIKKDFNPRKAPHDPRA